MTYKDLEKKRAYRRAYRLKNLEKIRKYNRQYMKTYQRKNREKCREIEKRCRRKRVARGRHAPRFYFFRSVSGFYKIGQTTNWANRAMNYRKNYPASVETRILFTPAKDPLKAEKQMKRFLVANGYSRIGRTEWFKRKKDWPLITWL